MAQTPTRKSGILYVPGIKGKVRVQLRELERRSLVVRRTDPHKAEDQTSSCCET